MRILRGWKDSYSWRCHGGDRLKYNNKMKWGKTVAVFFLLACWGRTISLIIILYHVEIKKRVMLVTALCLPWGSRESGETKI